MTTYTELHDVGDIMNGVSSSGDKQLSKTGLLITLYIYHLNKLIMKKLIILLFISAFILSCGKTDPMQKLIKESFIVIENQAVGMAEYLDEMEGRLPRSYLKEKDEIITSDSRWWCSGFYPLATAQEVRGVRK